jgi:hypothetical protein
MTLNYQMIVERYPNLKEEVGSSIPGCEISSLLDKKLARWSTVACALALACQPSIYKSNNKKRQNKTKQKSLNLRKYRGIQVGIDD